MNIKELFKSSMALVVLPLHQVFGGEYLKREYGNAGNLVMEKVYRNGRIARESPYKDEKKHGIHKVYTDGILLFEIPYENGLQHGMAKGYDLQGRLDWECPYVNGKEHGVEKEFFDNGNPSMERNFVHGQLDGDAIYYEKVGNVYERDVYKNGKLVPQPD